MFIHHSIIAPTNNPTVLQAACEKWGWNERGDEGESEVGETSTKIAAKK
jgi:hypothetical protein